jgi:hypothetical protein
MACATWDGRDLAAIQMLVAGVPRFQGLPVARVTPDWQLSVLTHAGMHEVPVGYEVHVIGERVSVALVTRLDLSIGSQ